MHVPGIDALTKALGATRRSRRAAVRLPLGLAAAVGGVGASRTHGHAFDQAWQGTPPAGGAEEPSASLSFDLEGSDPVRYESGTLRSLTRRQMPALDGLAFVAERVDPGGLRETHWHPNAGELGYCLAGRGAMSVFAPDGTGDTFAIGPGNVTFIPAGSGHSIRNAGADPLHLVLAFTDASPETIDLSQALPAVPTQFLAQTVGVATTAFPFLPPRGDRRLVPIGAAPAPATTATPTVGGAATTPYTVNVSDVDLTTYEGGTVREVRVDHLPRLDGITVFPLSFGPRALREPHWHPNASELNYCVGGTAQLGIVAPDGSVETFVVGPGAAAYIPANWFHYIANLDDAPLEFLVFFGNAKPNHIDLSQLLGFFAPELLAASFGLDPRAFAALPKRGDVFVAAAMEQNGP